MNYYLAQANIARAIAPLDDPAMASFVVQLDDINAVADASAGFVWRHQSDDGDAHARALFGDDRMIFNMSVWESIEALHDFTYRSDHLRPFRDRRKWFAPMDSAHLVLWWIPAGQLPTVAEAKMRFDLLNAKGPSEFAFTLKRTFAPPQSAPLSH